MKNKKFSKAKFFSYMVILACISLILLGIVTVKSNKKNNTVSFPNPLKEVSSAKEMKKLLGFEVPIIKGKDVISYTVIGNGEKAIHGRVRYIDTTQMEIEKTKQCDISGIYGGKEIKKETIDGIEVEYMSYEKITYANWNYNGFSYSCSIDFDDIDYLRENIESIISIIKE